jgi:hypothetical protein
MRGHPAHPRIKCFRELVPLSEFLLSLPIEWLCLDPTVQPRQIVGSLQQRLWTVRDPPPEDLIPDNAQQGGKKQTGCDAKVGGRRDSHSGPFTLASILPEGRREINCSGPNRLKAHDLGSHQPSRAIQDEHIALDFRLLFSYTGVRVQPSANSAMRFRDPLQEVRRKHPGAGGHDAGYLDCSAVSALRSEKKLPSIRDLSRQTLVQT